MRISYWSSDVCSSDRNRLSSEGFVRIIPQVGCEVINPSYDQIADFYIMFERLEGLLTELAAARRTDSQTRDLRALQARILTIDFDEPRSAVIYCELNRAFHQLIHDRSEEHTSELQSLMRISYAVFCLKKQKHYKKYMQQ